MKKTVWALMATLVMSENMMADDYKIMSSGMSVGVQKMDSLNSYEIGYYMMTGKEMRYGWEFNLGAISANSEDALDVIGDVSGRFGYAPLSNLDIYGTLGYGVQTFAGGATSANGLVYGLALHYGISNRVGMAIDYKKYDLNHDYFDLDYDANAIGVKLNFTF